MCEQVPAKRGDKRTGLKRGDLRTIDVAMDADISSRTRCERRSIPTIRKKLRSPQGVVLSIVGHQSN